MNSEKMDKMSDILLSVKDLKKYYLVKKSFRKGKEVYLKAVDGVSFDLGRGETVGLVGESGCGKSTLGKTVLQLVPSTAGEILYDGIHLETCKDEEIRQLRRKMQLIYQDPFASMNPRMTIGQAVLAPLHAFGIGTPQEQQARVEELLAYVGLSQEHMRKFPHELSGGQRQRAVIARALVGEPELIVGDEPVSALDVSVRAQVLNLMKKMQKDFYLSMLFISHDMSVIRYMCDRVIVMYLGKIVEMAPREELFSNPLHPYTQALVSAIPVPEVKQRRGKEALLTGDVPSPMDIPSGCRFHTRCPHARPECSSEEPQLWEVSHGDVSPDSSSGRHFAACHLVK